MAEGETRFLLAERSGAHGVGEVAVLLTELVTRGLNPQRGSRTMARGREGLRMADP